MYRRRQKKKGPESGLITQYTAVSRPETKVKTSTQNGASSHHDTTTRPLSFRISSAEVPATEKIGQVSPVYEEADAIQTPPSPVYEEAAAVQIAHAASFESLSSVGSQGSGTTQIHVLENRQAVLFSGLFAEVFHYIAPKMLNETRSPGAWRSD